MLNIGIDLMGGDFAPQPVIEGCKLALEQDENLIITGYGVSDQCEPFFKKYALPKNQFNFIHCPEVIAAEGKPLMELKQKPHSSMNRGLDELSEKKIDGFCSAGNTGALLAGSMIKIGQIEAVSRPAIISEIWRINHPTNGVILDIGANSDCKPKNLLDFALLGTAYATQVLEINNPRVALLNIGEGQNKGSDLCKATYKLLANHPSINFIGNMEGNQIFDPVTDVIICDGFTGNIVLKLAESFYHHLGLYVEDKNIIEKFEYSSVGGCLFIGIKKPVVIGHGISNKNAIKNMILCVKKSCSHDITKKIQSLFNHE